jgi:hypothetical protein
MPRPADGVRTARDCMRVERHLPEVFQDTVAVWFLALDEDTALRDDANLSRGEKENAIKLCRILPRWHHSQIVP